MVTKTTLGFLGQGKFLMTFR